MRKQDVTYQDKLNELRLDLSHPNSKGITFVLVEGDTDIRLFRKFFNNATTKIEEIPGGKLKVEDCVEQLTIKYPLVIGLRDADFLHLHEQQYDKSNVYLTDYHDVEMIIVAVDEVFSSIIFEFTDYPIEQHLNIRNQIITVLEEISLLKWLNDKEDLRINFDGSGFKDLLSFDPLKLDFDQYFKRLLSKSPDTRITSIELVNEKIAVLRNQNPNPFNLCNGHDFIKALSHFLKEKGKGNGINDAVVSSLLRLRYTINFLSKTKLYKSIDDWAKRNDCSIYLN